jgi:hypothetical protein
MALIERVEVRKTLMFMALKGMDRLGSVWMGIR